MTVLEIIVSKYPQKHEDYGKWRGKKKASYLGFHAEHSTLNARKAYYDWGFQSFWSKVSWLRIFGW